MGKRAVQIALFACVGAFLAWWLMRDERDALGPPPVREKRVETIAAPVAPATRESSAKPAPSSFNLPKMGRPAPEPTTPEVPTEIWVPKNWLLRGSGSKNYELRSDRNVVFSGNFSAALFSHTKEVQPNLSGSAVQAVLAAPFVGTRVELSAALRLENPRATPGAIWIYVTDPARVVIAYQIAQEPVGPPGVEWQRYRIVMDVPWNGEVLAYGFTLRGKGKLWVDDVKLTPVDTNVPITGVRDSHQLGVIAQAVSFEGALANPSNMDFEDVQATRERQPPPPPDEIKGTRF